MKSTDTIHGDCTLQQMVGGCEREKERGKGRWMDDCDASVQFVVGGSERI